MTVIIAGMRRSGTTILFDALSEDQRFISIYEPFTFSKTNIGGGSGAKPEPYGDQLNSLRRKFIFANGLDLAPEYFNFGAPTDFRKEFERDLPQVFDEYLQYLNASGEHVLMKFVRVQDKIKHLHSLFPDAKLLHIVRDPRRVAESHSPIRRTKSSSVRGKIKRIWYKLVFFQARCGFNKQPWSSQKMADFLINRFKLSTMNRAPGYVKVMFLWKYINDRIKEDGLAHYGKNYFRISHEDLCWQPRIELERIYHFLEMKPSEKALTWAEMNIQPPRDLFRAKSKHWKRAILFLGIDQEDIR